MRLLIVGTLGGQLTTASKIAMDKGASVTHADSTEQALAVLRSGRGADLLMVDVSLDIRDLVARLDAERIHVAIVACGVTNDARAAVNAIHSGAKEYIPLPPDPDLIAAVLAAVPDAGSLAPGESENDDSINRGAADLEAVFDVPVQVSAVLGRARMEVGDLLKLGPGAVLELDRKVGEAIDIYVNNRLIARGEVVLVEDKLGVTMTEIIKADRN